MLSKNEKKQYNRHLILEEIGSMGQEKLKQFKVLVVGAGGLGCPVLQYLTAAGVGTIGIVDDDVVDQTNLQRQVLYTVDDIGSSKVEVASQKLKRLNPNIAFDIYNERLNKENVVAIFSKFDIIVDGTDNFPTRYLVNDGAVLANKPVVFGSIFKFEGQVSVFNYQHGPTYRCLFPEPPGEDALPNCSDIGVLGVLPGIMGSLMANEVLKMILDLGKSLNGKLLCLDALSLYQQIVTFSKNENSKITSLQDDYHIFCGTQEIQSISLDDYQNKCKEYVLLDVRTISEHEKFNIGGYHIPLHDLVNKAMELPHDKPVVVCCQSGIRSKKAIQLLSNLRKDLTLLNLEGGLNQFSS
ncbi:HesA/MoeB/ThiF family protein [Aquimarina intermedia]|uniref:Molybdopterin-synthase adenylyltransferase n=1 Tax=Aquimarina intermedia TaxID=350814 RepID=A0A5S5CCS9_9FLAO|nr:HesA/MoeB/ThiF family protein [Aquimarina intermedia]TYP77137.1 adenylyltransferase/sulfurtransferase [Aquimarina intermedia]